MILRASLFFVLFSLGQARASGSCVPILNEAPKPTHKILLKEMMTEEGSALVELLRMAGQTRNHFDAGSTKKREINLGRTLEDGFSLEFNYKLDERADSPQYSLAKVLLVDPNGAAEEISKRPLDPQQSRRLASVELDVPTYVKSQAVELPLVLEGQLLADFMKWAERFEFLKATDLRALQSEKELRGLYFKYFRGDQKDLYVSRARKEYSKVIFTVAIVLAINHLTSWFSDEDEAAAADSPFASLIDLIRGFEGQVLEGEKAVQIEQAWLAKSGAPTMQKEFVEPLPDKSLTRVVSISKYESAQKMLVQEVIYKGQEVVEARGIVAQKGKRTYEALEKALSQSISQ